MNDYGFKPSVLFGLAAEEGYFPENTDFYNPADSYLGNSRARPVNGVTPDYDSNLDMVTPRQSAIDVRLFFTQRKPEEWAPCRWGPDSDVPHFYKYSHVSAN